jgi:sulfonate transport system permease protein
MKARVKHIAVLLCCWLWPFVAVEIFCRLNAHVAKVVAPPSQILSALLNELQTGLFWISAWATVSKVGIAAFIAFFLAYPLGLVAGLSAWSRKAFADPVDAARSIPTLLLIPVLMLFLPIGDKMIIAMAAYPTLGMIFVGVADAVGACNESRGRICRAMGMERMAFAKHCLLWETAGKAAMLVTSALPMTVALVVALEYFDYTNAGLGHLVSRIRQMREPGYLAQMYSIILCCGLLGLGSVLIPKFVFSRMLTWTRWT